jgi:hypothetical protein
MILPDLFLTDSLTGSIYSHEAFESQSSAPSRQLDQLADRNPQARSIEPNGPLAGCALY